MNHFEIPKSWHFLQKHKRILWYFSDTAYGGLHTGEFVWLFSSVRFQQFLIIFRCRLRWVTHRQRREWRTKRDSSPVPSLFSTRSTFLALFLFFFPCLSSSVYQYFYSSWKLKQICLNFIFLLWFHFEHFAVFNLWEIVAAAIFSWQKVVGGKIFLWSWSSLISASVTNSWWSSLWKQRLPWGKGFPTQKM